MNGKKIIISKRFEFERHEDGMIVGQVYNLREKYNLCKKVGAAFEDIRELQHAYGNHSFYRTIGRVATLTDEQLYEFKKLARAKSKKTPRKILTDAEKQEQWCRRLVKLVGDPTFTLAQARTIAQEKIDYKANQIYMMQDRQCENPSRQRGKLINKMERENPLRRIEDVEHAQAILAASHRHNNTNYESKLEEGRELASMGELDRADVRDFARQEIVSV